MNKEELIKIKEKALENHIPIIMDDTLEVVDKILKELKPKKILEIGTAVGYSAMCFSEYLQEGGIIDTMNMNEVIARINELARKAKVSPLSPEELQERDKLRKIYIDSVKANLVSQLENTYILEPDGTKKKLEHK